MSSERQQGGKPPFWDREGEITAKMRRQTLLRTKNLILPPSQIEQERSVLPPLREHHPRRRQVRPGGRQVAVWWQKVVVQARWALPAQ